MKNPVSVMWTRPPFKAIFLIYVHRNFLLPSRVQHVSVRPHRNQRSSLTQQQISAANSLLLWRKQANEQCREDLQALSMAASSTRFSTTENPQNLKEKKKHTHFIPSSNPRIHPNLCRHDASPTSGRITRIQASSPEPSASEKRTRSEFINRF